MLSEETVDLLKEKNEVYTLIRKSRHRQYRSGSYDKRRRKTRDGQFRCGKDSIVL